METPEQYTKTPEEKLFTPWTMRKCDCGHESCEDYFVSLTRSDGRVTKEQGELIILAPDMIKCLRMIDECLKDGIPIEKDDPIHVVIKKLLKP